MRGLYEGLHDREAAVATLAIPIRPLIRVKHVRRYGLGLVSSKQRQVHWVRPPELGVETRWRRTGAWPGRGRGAEIKPHGSRDVVHAVGAAAVLSHKACGVAADADHVLQCFPGEIAGQARVSRGEQRGVDIGLELERSGGVRRGCRH